MPVTLKLDHPNFPDDAEFGISTLGRVMNHGTLEVDDETVSEFEATHEMSISDYFKNNALITVTATQAQQPGQDQQQQQAPEPPVAPESEGGEN